MINRIANVSRSLNRFLKWSPLAIAIAFTLPFGACAGDNDASTFYLKSGDHVCFYGDSITEQRYYGIDVETYLRTRFPDLHVKFVNSGVGGDCVTGGWGGGIDERLQRDVYPFKPNVVTIMLGMNDGKYQPFNQHIFEVYTNGYEHIIQELQRHLPGVRIVLIQPTPYDDISYPPKFPGGYNGVLLRYAVFVRQLATEHHLMCVDFMTPMLDVLKKAEAQNPKLAHDVIPGRIHPSAVGELIMAQALLKAWSAPSTVTAVTIDAANQNAVQSDNTAVSDLQQTAGTISWTQNDKALPFPILGLHDRWWQFPPVVSFTKWPPTLTFLVPPPQPKWNYTNAASQMVVEFSGFYDDLDQEPLTVHGLQSGNYELKINDQSIGQFSAAQLDHGINLAEYRTPMLLQAYDLLGLVYKQVQWRFYAWRAIQLQLAQNHDPAVQQASESLMTALHAQKEKIEQSQYVANRPRPTHYELVRVTQ